MPLLQPPHDASLGGAAAARPPPAATAHDGPVRFGFGFGLGFSQPLP